MPGSSPGLRFYTTDEYLTTEYIVNTIEFCANKDRLLSIYNLIEQALKVGHQTSKYAFGAGWIVLIVPLITFKCWRHRNEHAIRMGICWVANGVRYETGKEGKIIGIAFPNQTLKEIST